MSAEVWTVDSSLIARRSSLPPDVVYVVPDKRGGMTNLIANLLAQRPHGMAQSIVLTHNRLAGGTRFAQPLAADEQATIEYSLPLENLHAVLRRLAAAIPPGPGVLVANDLLELAMLSCHDPRRTVVQILHGDHPYYYRLATLHEPVIDVFVTISRVMHQRLGERLPHRADSIVLLPHGIPIPARTRAAADGPLRLVFAGRIENSQKGVFDLPAIDRRLGALGVAVAWTIIGAGPDEAELRRRWGTAARVEWLGLRTTAEVAELLARHDVFVLPTRWEGFPLALLEGMGSGLVPVVSDIPSAVPEVVEQGRTGFRPPAGDIEAFADAIARLARDREALERMSRAARRTMVERFDVKLRAPDYHALFERCARMRPRRGDLPLPYGSRLDRPWLPNAAVYALRSARRWMRRPPPLEKGSQGGF